MDSKNVTSADPFGFGAAIDSAIGGFLGTSETPKEEEKKPAAAAAAGTFSGKTAETDAEHVREFTKEAGQPTPDTPRGAGARRSGSNRERGRTSLPRAGRRWTAPRSSSSPR